jgi:hypothetical protein
MSLPGILSNVANKVLLDGFNSVEQVWRSISRVRPVNDFKVSKSYRLTDNLEYEELPPGGTIKSGQVSEDGYSVQARTYARMFSLDRTAIINDDLGAFDDLRTRLGRGAAVALNKIFWKTFLDNSAFFTSARGNLLTGALTDDPNSLSEAVATFSALADAGGAPLGVQPSILLVPPALAPTARRLFASAEVRNTTSDSQYVTANVYQGMFAPVASAYLSSAAIPGHSSTAWWLCADPRVLPVMEVAFLGGKEMPTVESADVVYDQLGIQFRGYHDFGCSLAEWRGGVKSTGQST